LWKINTVKKLILFAFASLVIISCRKDDDDEKEESLILGTWNLTKVQVISGKDNSVISSYLITDCPEKRKYEFFDNQYRMTYFKDSFLVDCDVLETETGEFTYDKNQKYILFNSTFGSNSYSYAVNVNSISTNELQISESGFSYDANVDGIDDKVVRIFNK